MAVAVVLAAPQPMSSIAPQAQLGRPGVGEVAQQGRRLEWNCPPSVKFMFAPTRITVPSLLDSPAVRLRKAVIADARR